MRSAMRSVMKRAIWTIWLITALALGACSANNGGEEPVDYQSPIPSNQILSSDNGNPLIDSANGGESTPIDEGIVGSGDPPLPGGDDELIASPIEGQIELGPVVKATVDIYDIDNLTSPVFTTTTIDSTDLQLAGTFTIPGGVIYKSKLYLVKGSGGFDIDIDDDGILNENDTDVDGNGIKDLEDDEDKDGELNKDDKDYSGGIHEPVPVQGVTRLLITGKQMASLKWNASAITEYVFEALQYSELNNSVISDVLDTMDQMAPILLGQDLNGDDLINAIDLMIWDPDSSFYQDTTFSPQQMREFIKLVHDGKNVTVSSIPSYKRLLSHVDTKSSAERVIVEGDIAYVATPGMLLLYDISDQKNPELVGRYFTGPIRDFVVDKNNVFYANESGLSKLDVSDPKQPTLIKSIALDVIKLKLSNDKLILINAEKNNENESVNYLTTISTSTLEKMASEKLPDRYSEISVSNNLAYIWYDFSYNYDNYNYYSDAKLRVYNIGDKTDKATITLSKNFGLTNFNVLDSDHREIKEVARWRSNKIFKFHETAPLTELDYRDYIEVDKQPYDGFNLITVHGNYLFSLSDKHTYSVYDMTDMNSPQKLAATLDLCAEHTALRFTDKFIMTKCRDEFRFWNINSFEFLGAKSVAAFNIKPGVLLDPGNGLNLLEKMYSLVLNYYLDLNNSSFFDEGVIHITAEIIRDFNFTNVFKSFFNWRKWGIMMTHDFEIAGETVFLATGAHGLQILNFDDIAVTGEASGSISLGELSDQEGKIVATNGLVGDATVSIVPLSNLATSDTCSGISSSEDANAGKVLIPKDCIERDTYYLVTAEGGHSLNPDNDGIYDESPAEMKGKIHGIFSMTEIYSGNWQVNLYTEYLYQKVKLRIENYADLKLILHDIVHEKDLIKDKISQLNTLLEPIYKNDSAALSKAINEISSDQVHFYSYGFDIKDIIATESRLYLVDWENILHISDAQTHNILTSLQLPESPDRIYIINDFLYVISGPEYLPADLNLIGKSQITQINVENDILSIVAKLSLDEKVLQLVDNDDLGLLALTHAHFFQIQPPGFAHLELSEKYKAKFGALETAKLVAKNANALVTVTEQLKSNQSYYPEEDTHSLINNLDPNYSSKFSQEHIFDLSQIKAWDANGLTWQEVNKSPFLKYGDDISDPSVTFSVNDLVIASMNYYLGGYFSPILPKLYPYGYHYIEASLGSNIRIMSAADLSHNLMKPASVSIPSGERILTISISDDTLTLFGNNSRLKRYSNYVEAYDLQDPQNPQLLARYDRYRTLIDEKGDYQVESFDYFESANGKPYVLKKDYLSVLELGSDGIARELWRKDLEGAFPRAMTIVGKKAYVTTFPSELVDAEHKKFPSKALLEINLSE